MNTQKPITKNNPINWKGRGGAANAVYQRLLKKLITNLKALPAEENFANGGDDDAHLELSPVRVFTDAQQVMENLKKDPELENLLKEVRSDEQVETNSTGKIFGSMNVYKVKSLLRGN